jgi:hypothetical protein
MFNYWTEGGFIAWGQTPDPNTGKTPLKLFMDGRAQAAYNYDAYIEWQDIMSCGITGRILATTGRQPTANDLEQIANFIDEQLRKKNVWVVLMPSNQFGEPFVRALDFSPYWQVVFINDNQKLFVDVRTERGRELFDGVETGATKYPDKYSEELVKAHNRLYLGANAAVRQQGLEYAIDALQLRPSISPAHLIRLYYQRFPELQPRIAAFYKSYLEDFEQNKKTYENQDGLHHRIIAAIGAYQQAAENAQKEKNEEKLNQCEKRIAQLESEVRELRDRKKW